MRELMIRAVCAGMLAFAGSAAMADSETNLEQRTFRIIPPWQNVAGQTQAYWAQKWWNWILNIRQDVNPNFEVPSATDPTGGKYASINNDGPIIFLPGSSAPGKTTRTVTIPPGRPLLVPVVNAEFVAFPTAYPCPDPLTVACGLGVIKSGLDDATGLSIEIDGVRFGQAFVRLFRPISTSVAELWVNPDPDNVYAPFGKPLGVFGYFPDKAVQDGYYVFLHHLTLGRHVIRTTGRIAAPFDVAFDVTTTVCVGVNTNVAGACRE